MKALFGTDGIRNKVGTHPFTVDALPELGKAFGEWVINKYGANSRILLAHDTRASCSWVKASFKSGLLLNPINVYDSHVLPTPGVFQRIKYTDMFDLGIIISASHNPYYDNGIKIVTKHGKLSHEDEQEITRLFYQENSSMPTYEDLGNDIRLHKAQKVYLHNILELCRPNLRGKTIVLDCANGATSHIAPYIFNACGATLKVINNHPNGKNINENCGATSLDALKQEVLKTGADAGFAFDGDGDRIIAVNNKGEVKDGDDILVLLSHHPLYQSCSTIVGTVMSNQGLEAHCKENNKTLVRTDVGDKHIIKELINHNLILGGEPSGHIIMGDYLHVCDAILVALRILETVIQTNNWQMKTFKKYPQVLINVPIKEKKDLSQKQFTDLIAASETTIPAGRILVRYSGTEPIIRVMTEAPDSQAAQVAAANLSQELAKLLS